MTLLRLSAITRRWRITLDPCYADAPREERGDYEQIVGKRGVVYAFDRHSIAVNCELKYFQNRLAGLPGTTLFGASTWHFGPGLLDDVCRIIRARKKRRVSAEQRARLTQQLVVARAKR